MVYESSTVYPTPEGEQRTSPPPVSTYGFQKLATRVLRPGRLGAVRAAVHDRPAVQLRRRSASGGRCRDKEILCGNVKLAMSHVVPDLVQKVLKGQDPLHILGDGGQVRHYTYGGDLAPGIRLAIESPAALNEDFNLSTAVVHDGARAGRMHLEEDPRRTSRSATSATRRSARRAEARPRRREGEARSSASRRRRRSTQMLDEIIPWIRSESEAGRL